MKLLAAFSIRMRDAHPDHHAIFTGMAWVTLFVLLGKLVGAAKEMAVAYRYGVGIEVDAYLFVANVVAWPAAVWFSLLTSALVPLVARMLQKPTAELQRFRAELFGVSLLLGLLLGVLAWLGLTLFLRSAWTGLPPATVNIAMRVVPAFVILVPLGMLTSLFSAWMLAAGRHSNTLLEGVPALAIIIAVLLFANGGIEPLIWGTVAGHILYMISLTIPLQRHREIEAPCFSRKSDQWVWFWHSCGIMLGGQALLSMITVIDQFFAVHLGSGAIATLSYSDRIMALLLGLGGTAVSRATLPVFSRAQESGGAQVRKVAMRWMHLMLILGILSAAMAWWLAPFAVKLIFQRGAFSAQDSMAVAAVLRYAVVQLPFYFAGLVLVSYLVSRGLHKYVAIGACVNFLVKLGGNYLFIPLMGLNGIVVATTSMYIVSFIMLYRLARGQDAMKSEI